MLPLKRLASAVVNSLVAFSRLPALWYGYLSGYLFGCLDSRHDSHQHWEN